MQSKISYFNKTIFKKNITHYWPIWFGYLLVCLFEIPFGIYVSSRDVFYYTGLTPEELIEERTRSFVGLANSVMSPVLVFVVALIVAMAMFSYLHNSKSANMIHSLPVRREELFFTNYISGLLFMAVPQTVATLIGVFVCAAVGITELQYLMIAFLYSLGNMVFFYSFAVFVGMLTGQLLALPVYYFILNFLEIMMEAIVKVVMSGICFGVDGMDQLSRLLVLSPIYFLTEKTGIRVSCLDDGGYGYEVMGGKYVLAYFLVSFVLLALSLFAYKKRKIESAGDMISICWLKPVFRWCVTVCGALIGGMIFGQIFQGTVSGSREFVIILVSAILIGAVSFFIAEMFLEKKFKVFKKKRFYELGIGSVMIVAAFLLLEFDAFGIESRTPDVSEVEMASLDYSSLLLTDEDDIQELIDIHKEIVSHKKEIEAYTADRTNDSYETSIVYKLKDGSKLCRYYNLPSAKEYLDDADSEMSRILALMGKPENMLKSQFGVYYNENVLQGGYLATFSWDGSMGAQENDITFDKDNAAIIYEAVKKDIEEGNFDDVLQFQHIGNGSFLNDEVYVNTVCLELYNKKGVRYPYSIMEQEEEDAYPYTGNYARYYSNEDYSYVTIGRKCKYTIAALKEVGVITDESDLVTYQEYDLYDQENNYTD